MSDTMLLIFLTSLILLSGCFLTSGWHQYLVARRNRKSRQQG